MIVRALSTLSLLIAGMLLSGSSASGQDFRVQRQQFIQAREALRAGDLDYFYRIANRLKHYPLYPYLQYDYLAPRLSQATEREIGDFLDTYPDTVLNTGLRIAWLKILAGQEQWHTFLKYYTPQTDPLLRCYHLKAKLSTRSSTEVLHEVKALWLVGKPQPKECDPVFDYLLLKAPQSEDLIWQRIGLAMTAGELSLARQLSKRLDPAAQQWAALWLEMHEHPATVLARWQEPNDQPITREILAHGITRLAKQDAGYAYNRWLAIKRRYQYTDSVIARVERALVLAGAAHDRHRALQWLDKIDGRMADAELQHARLRAALASRDWTRLVRWTEQEPAADMEGLCWRYWRARALEETGAREIAQALYRSLANESDYYGFMAADRLGLPYALKTNGPVLTAQKEIAILALPPILRAQELYLAGYLAEARAEWEYATTQLPPEQIRTAAALAAKRWGWHDRAIRVLGRAKLYDELEVRFPTPFQNLVSYSAQAHYLEPATVYGFMRAESAFNAQARSPAGALGLMQLMPATARYTAAKVGIGPISTAQVLQPEINVKLGTAYLRQMLDKFDGHLVMAAAAYNAGPGRVTQWQPSLQCMPAELWIELIPFTETRKYVRNILFYTAIYQWRMGQRVKPLATRLAAIAPKLDNGVAHLSCISRASPLVTAD
jgi:soluble lytic murein transglycosylase